jgi:Domain of unknown function (DUF1330)
MQRSRHLADGSWCMAAWYESAAYQKILSLRTDNSESDTFLVDGVSEGHRATDVLTA